MQNKLTNRQLKVYNWLLERKGYLKCSIQRTIVAYPEYTTVKDFNIAFKAAKDTIKNTPKIIEYKKDPIRNKIVKKVINNEHKKIYINTKVNLDIHNVLVIPDTHEPFCKEGLLEHCLKVQKDHKCGTVVHIGDEVDLHAISQWEKDPNGFSAGTEATLAQAKMELWYKAFPEVKVCIGNHTARPFRMARANGIPKKFIKSYEEAWNAPKGWKWEEHWEIDGVLYTHGTGCSGPNAALRIATRHRQNTVIGHIHSEVGIQYNASKIDLIWGMQVGGGLDDKSYAAAYAKDQLKKTIVGCGVVKGGKLPLYEPMNL